MAKQNEIEYPIRIGEHLAGAAAKPFSEPACGAHLVRIGTMMTLLPPAPARILDLGCGTGWTSLFFARPGYEVVGVDIAPEMIRVANELRDGAKLTNLSFAVSDYEGLTYRNEFDAVVFFDSLHHAENEKLAIQRAFEALKPGGVFLAEEPGEGHAQSEGARVAVAEYGVTEKDMPPAHIVEIGRTVGFAGFRVFPHPDELGDQVYHLRSQPLTDPFSEVVPPAPAPVPAPSFASRVLRRVQCVFRGPPAPIVPPTPAWRLTNVDHLLLHIRSTGLVLMRKGGTEGARAAA